MTFNPTEKHQSQIPALQLLVALGFTPLSQTEALALRGNRLSNVLLDDILADQLLKINRFAHRGREYQFDLEDAHEAIRRLRPHPDKAKGLRGTNQEVYDLLVLGTTITQRIGGDTKSYSFRYIDWEGPANNVYHVTAEMAVERTGSVKTRRCDVVAFVNGIPFVVAENKRPTEKSEKAGSQLIGYQKEVNIPHLFHFAQLLLALNRQDGRYATVGTAAKFWQGWRTSTPNATSGASIATDAPPAPPPTSPRHPFSASLTAPSRSRKPAPSTPATSPTHAPTSMRYPPKAPAASPPRTARSTHFADRSASSTSSVASRCSTAASARSLVTSSISRCAAPWSASSTSTCTASARVG